MAKKTTRSKAAKKSGATASRKRKAGKGAAATAGKKKAPRAGGKAAAVKTSAKRSPAAKAPAKSAAKAKAPAKPKPKAKVPAKRKVAKAKAPRRPTPAKLRRFRALLVAKHQSLVQSYNSSKGNTREIGGDGTEDYIDYAVSSYDRDFTLSLTELERSQLLLVEEALRRIDRRVYGTCQQCGQEIMERRLEVEPWARHCIRCQELEEQGLLLLHSGDDGADDEIEDEEDEDEGNADGTEDDEGDSGNAGEESDDEDGDDLDL